MRRLPTLLAGMLIALGALAEPLSPDVLVRRVTGEVMESLRTEGDGGGRTADLVAAKILPNFDFQKMTSLALGKDWRQATPAQQAALAEEFRILLVRTYSNALTAYKGQAVEIKPLKAGGGDAEVTVRTEVRQPGTPPVSIDYAMARKEDAWRIHDVTVGGISLVTAYRDQFAQEVRNGGIDGLIRVLRAKNGGKAPGNAGA